MLCVDWDNLVINPELEDIYWICYQFAFCRTAMIQHSLFQGCEQVDRLPELGIILR